MRLPAITKRQQAYEDARLVHERLYDARLAGQRVVIPSTDPKRTQAYYSGNLRRFWNERGFALKTKTVPAGLELWIEPLTYQVGRKR